MNSGQDSESFMMEVTHVFTRREAEAELKHILDRFKSDQHTSVTEEMANRITLKHLKVLSKGDISYIRMWANSVGDHRVLGLLEISSDDLESYSWTQMVEKPMSELSSINPAYTLWKEAKDSLVEKGRHESKQSKFAQLRGMIEDQGKKSSDSHSHTQKQLAELREDVSAIKSDLASVKQQNAEIIQLLKGVPELAESEDPVFSLLQTGRKSRPYRVPRVKRKLA